MKSLLEIMQSAAGSQARAGLQVRCEFDLQHFAHYFGTEVVARNPQAAIERGAFDSICQKLQAWQKSHKPGLILAGNKGNGKTTIARALYLASKYFVDHSTSGAGKEYRLPAWVTEKQIVGMVEAGKEDAYERLEGKNVLFVDDLGEASTEINRYGTIKTPAVDLLETRYARRLCTVITTNFNLDDIRAKYGERVEDRLKETCEVIAFNGQSYRK